jgi:hypothetical protein
VSSNKLQTPEQETEEGSDGRICRSKTRGARDGWIARLTRQEDRPSELTCTRVSRAVQARPRIRCAGVGRRLNARMHCWRLAASDVKHMGLARAIAGQDLVGGIDHGPGSNQPVHHLHLPGKRRREKRSLAALRYDARQQVKQESLCCLCQASGQEGDGLGQVLKGAFISARACAGVCGSRHSAAGRLRANQTCGF